MFLTYVLQSGDDHEEFEAEKFGEGFAAEHVVLETALEAYHRQDGPDCGCKLEGLELLS